jgi:hypothetical protein
MMGASTITLANEFEQTGETDELNYRRCRSPIGAHSLGFGSSTSAMPWMRETSGGDAGAPGID